MFVNDMEKIRNNQRVGMFRDWMITPIIAESSTNNYVFLSLPSVRQRAIKCIIHSKKMVNRSSILNELIGERTETVALIEMIKARDESLIYNIDLSMHAAKSIGVMNAISKLPEDDPIRRIIIDKYPRLTKIHHIHRVY